SQETTGSIPIDIVQPPLSTNQEGNVDSVPNGNGKRLTSLPAKQDASERPCKFDGTDYPAWLGFDPFRNPEQPFSFPLPSTDGDPWEKAGSLVKDYDDNMCGAWVEEIENILIFAGLFSAVVTAFAVETQKLLQPDPNVASVVLLAHIANQLPTANASFTSQILTPFLSPNDTFQSLRINTFIFVSLVLSLGTALIGIISLQWIRSYRKREILSHQDQLCVRQSRHEGLIKWKVPEIISYLPLVLQVSLVIFFAGLIDFLFSLNSQIAGSVGAVVGIILVFVSFTTIIPGLYIKFYHNRAQSSPLPPYQSPQSWLFYQFLEITTRIWHWIRKHEWSHAESSLSWTQLISDQKSYDHWLNPALTWIFRNFNSAQSFCAAYQCFQLLPKHELAEKTIKQLDPDQTFTLVKPFKSDRPVVYKQLLSILLLNWDRRRRPPRHEIDLHRVELTIRSLALCDTSDPENVDENPRILPDLPLIRRLLQPPDRRTYDEMQLVAEWKSWLFVLLIVLHSPPRPSFDLWFEFKHFWDAVIGLNARNCNDVVDSCLDSLVQWTSRQSPSQIQDEYGVYSHRQSLLNQCLQGMFDYFIFSEHRVDKTALRSLCHRPSFLTFLDCFADDNEFHAVWRESLFGGFKARWAGDWDRLLVDFGMDPKYWVLGHNHSRVAQLHSERESVRRRVSFSSSTYFHHQPGISHLHRMSFDYHNRLSISVHSLNVATPASSIMSQKETNDSRRTSTEVSIPQSPSHLSAIYSVHNQPLLANSANISSQPQPCSATVAVDDSAKSQPSSDTLISSDPTALPTSSTMLSTPPPPNATASSS
ncbi:hypothetical protein CVT24_004891, partial [Panaeolus cyanescens]